MTNFFQNLWEILKPSFPLCFLPIISGAMVILNAIAKDEGDRESERTLKRRIDLLWELNDLSISSQDQDEVEE